MEPAFAISILLGVLGVFASVFSRKRSTAGAVRKRNPQVNASLPVEDESLIAERARALGITKSRFVTLIIARWRRSGARAVNEADEALLARADSKAKAPKG